MEIVRLLVQSKIITYEVRIELIHRNSPKKGQFPILDKKKKKAVPVRLFSSVAGSFHFLENRGNVIVLNTCPCVNVSERLSLSLFLLCQEEGRLTQLSPLLAPVSSTSFFFFFPPPCPQVFDARDESPAGLVEELIMQNVTHTIDTPDIYTHAASTYNRRSR